MSSDNIDKILKGAFGSKYGNTEDTVPKSKIQSLISEFNSIIIEMEKQVRSGKELSDQGVGKKVAYQKLVNRLRELVK